MTKIFSKDVALYPIGAGIMGMTFTSIKCNEDGKGNSEFKEIPIICLIENVDNIPPCTITDPEELKKLPPPIASLFIMDMRGLEIIEDMVRRAREILTNPENRRY